MSPERFVKGESERTLQNSILQRIERVTGRLSAQIHIALS